MADHDGCYDEADLRDLCLAIAADFDHESHAAANAAANATSAVTRFQAIGRANAYRNAARIARMAAPKIDN